MRDSSSSSSVKENTLSPSAAAEYKRYLRKSKLQNASKVALRHGLRRAGIIVAPCLLLCAVLTMGQYNDSTRVRRSLFSSNRMPEIISHAEPECRGNAIAYLINSNASFASLERSLDLLYKNYLDDFYQNTHLFLFHTGEMQEQLEQLEWRFDFKTRGTIQLVNIAHTTYWLQSSAGNLRQDKLIHKNEHHFWGIKVWDYFDEHNRLRGCNYRYVMRLHHESYIYSPIKYEIFQYMEANNYNYGFRLCSFEMESADFLWQDFTEHSPVMPEQDWSIDDCAVYSPFFVADLQFFLSRKVQRFLNYVDKGRYIYRHAVDTSILHSIAVYAFSEPSRIHRFLDFTMEHFYHSPKTGCPQFGAMQAGYNDLEATQHLEEWAHLYLKDNHCKKSTRSRILSLQDLEPAYAHLPRNLDFSLPTISAGQVELARDEIMKTS